MSWNYRIVKRVFPHEDPDLTIIEFAIHEVYYDENGKAESVTEDIVHPYGETLSELKVVTVRYLEAFEKPVLNYESLQEIEK